jgi:SNF2 family DNA or RNA helicase
MKRRWPRGPRPVADETKTKKARYHSHLEHLLDAQQQRHPHPHPPPSSQSLASHGRQRQARPELAEWLARRPVKTLTAEQEEALAGIDERESRADAYHGARSALLYAPMGFGKTLAAQACIVRSLQEHVRAVGWNQGRAERRSIIVVPKSLAHQWQQHWAREWPTDTVTVKMVLDAAELVSPALQTQIEYARPRLEFSFTPVRQVQCRRGHHELRGPPQRSPSSPSRGR